VISARNRYFGSWSPSYASQQIRFFENTIGQAGNHIAITLEGAPANRSAIGARVTVTADGVSQTRDGFAQATVLQPRFRQ